MSNNELTPFQIKILNHELYGLFNCYPINRTGIPYEDGETALYERIDYIMEVLKKT